VRTCKEGAVWGKQICPTQIALDAPGQVARTCPPKMGSFLASNKGPWGKADDVDRKKCKNVQERAKRAKRAKPDNMQGRQDNSCLSCCLWFLFSLLRLLPITYIRQIRYGNRPLNRHNSSTNLWALPRPWLALSSPKRERSNKMAERQREWAKNRGRKGGTSTTYKYGVRCTVLNTVITLSFAPRKRGGFGAVPERVASREGANHTAKDKTPGTLACYRSARAQGNTEYGYRRAETSRQRGGPLSVPDNDDSSFLDFGLLCSSSVSTTVLCLISFSIISLAAAFLSLACLSTFSVVHFSCLSPSLQNVAHTPHLITEYQPPHSGILPPRRIGRACENKNQENQKTAAKYGVKVGAKGRRRPAKLDRDFIPFYCFLAHFQ
jgi:hypothetical protein